jgi:enoyl-[acyl-carrier-protein] reductase (NADH)
MEDAMGLGATRIPARRVGEHGELANLAAYLLADGSAYVTGECVTIDGGRSLMAGTFNDLAMVEGDAVLDAMRAMRPKKG